MGGFVFESDMAAWLRLYGTVFSLGVQGALVYRWNFFARAAFGLLPLVATVWIWREIYGARGTDVGGYSFGDMVFYFVVATVVESLVSPTNDEWQIAEDIREGRISAYLLRPVDYLTYRASLFLSSRVVYAVLALAPLLAVVWWLPGKASWPADAGTWVVFGVALGLAAALQFLIAFVLATLAFWVLEISTLVFILYSFEYFLSGRIFPIEVLPDGLRTLLMATPFPYELYFPVAVLMGKLTGAAMWTGLAMQVAWVTAFFLLARGLWKRGVARYGAFGG